MVWEQELYNNFKYFIPRPYFHTFVADVCYIKYYTSIISLYSLVYKTVLCLIKSCICRNAKQGWISVMPTKRYFFVKKSRKNFRRKCYVVKVCIIICCATSRNFCSKYVHTIIGSPRRSVEPNSSQSLPVVRWIDNRFMPMALYVQILYNIPVSV